MSGIFLIVWDTAHKKNLNDPLMPTSGGYPHITVVYSGNRLAMPHLLKMGKIALGSSVGNTVTLVEPYINSFVKEDGTQRHDVLLRLDVDATKYIDELRSALVSICDPDTCDVKEAHVTAKICTTEAEAKEYCDTISKRMPFDVTITGVTLD